VFWPETITQDHQRVADCLCGLRIPSLRGSAAEPTAPGRLLKSTVSRASGRAMTSPTVVALDNVPTVEQPRCCQDPQRLADWATRKAGDLAPSSEVTAPRRTVTLTVSSPPNNRRSTA